MYNRVYVCVSVCVHACTYACAKVCVCTGVCVCVYVCVYIEREREERFVCLHTYSSKQPRGTAVTTLPRTRTRPGLVALRRAGEKFLALSLSLSILCIYTYSIHTREKPCVKSSVGLIHRMMSRSWYHCSGLSLAAGACGFVKMSYLPAT